MKHNIEDSVTQIFCFVDDLLKQNPDLLSWRESNNASPRFSDSEAVTIALLQSHLEVATLKQTYRLVADNCRDCFPALPTYQQWLARVHRCGNLINTLLAATCGFWNTQDELFLIDSFPIPVCLPVRHGTARLLRDEGAYFGKSSKGWFFGFKIHALQHISGRVVNLLLTPANVDDRAAAHLLTESIGGEAVIGDLGYRGAEFQTEVWEENMVLILTRNIASREKKYLLGNLRQAVERMFSQWWRKFTSRVFSRSWRGLWNTVQLKVLYYNLVHAEIL